MSFRKERSKRKDSRKCGSLFIPIELLPSSVSYKFTPRNNLNFSPANNRHYDLNVADSRELAEAILSGLKSGAIGWTYLEKDDYSFRFQMVIAYAHCTHMLGKLQEKPTPSGWKDGHNLSAAEQIETLRHLSGVDELYHPKKT